MENTGGVDGLPFVVAGAPLAGWIEVLESESQWIDMTMAHRTPFVGSMPLELFTDCRGTACVGFEFGDAGRGRVGGVAQQVAQHPDTTNHR